MTSLASMKQPEKGGVVDPSVSLDEPAAEERQTTEMEKTASVDIDPVLAAVKEKYSSFNMRNPSCSVL